MDLVVTSQCANEGGDHVVSLESLSGHDAKPILAQSLACLGLHLVHHRRLFLTVRLVRRELLAAPIGRVITTHNGAASALTRVFVHVGHRLHQGPALVRVIVLAEHRRHIDQSNSHLHPPQKLTSSAGSTGGEKSYSPPLRSRCRHGSEHTSIPY